MQNDRNSGWRESIWSVPRPFVFAYLTLVTLLGLPTVVVIVWEKAQAVNAHWWAWHTELIRAAAPECGWIGIGIAFSALVTVQGVAIVMVGYRYAIERWVKPMAEKRRAESYAAGRADGREEGRTETNQQWQEWLQRKTEAESRGLPFDEPPPGAAQP